MSASTEGSTDPLGDRLVAAAHRVAELPAILDERLRALDAETFVGRDRHGTVSVALSDSCRSARVDADPAILTGVPPDEVAHRVEEAHAEAAGQYVAGYRDVHDLFRSSTDPLRPVLEAARTGDGPWHR